MGEASPYAWKLVALLSLGGCFEIYNLALTATLGPGLIRRGIVHEHSRGIWGLTDQASFALATIAGLFRTEILLLAVETVVDPYDDITSFTYAR